MHPNVEAATPPGDPAICGFCCTVWATSTTSWPECQACSAGLNSRQDPRELLDVAFAEPLEEVRANRREVGGRGLEQSIAAGLRRRDPGGARVARVSSPLDETFALEFHRES